MMTAALELARSRKTLRLSLNQLSKRTGLSRQWLDAIEQGDLDRLPDMVRLRECVGMFAQEVGLDPDSLSARYMAQLRRSSLEEFDSEKSSSVDTPDRAAVPALSWGRSGYAALVSVTLITLSIGFWTSAIREEPAARRENARADAPRILNSDLDGSWLLTSYVDKSSVRSFEDLTLGFRLQLEQNGDRVRGHGVKWTENGRLVASRARTPISLDGRVDQNRLVLAFTERGVRRTSHGTLYMQIADNGTLHGRFSTDAGLSSGWTRAVRVSSQRD